MERETGITENVSPSARFIGGLVLLYFVAGKLGLRLAFVEAHATAVWPPAGLALAALLLGGLRLWPGVLLGAFLVNVTTAATPLTAAGIALGNTLEAVAGAWLLQRFAGGARPFENSRSIFWFGAVAFAAGAI